MNEALLGPEMLVGRTARPLAAINALLAWPSVTSGSPRVPNRATLPVSVPGPRATGQAPMRVAGMAATWPAGLRLEARHVLRWPAKRDLVAIDVPK